MVCMFLSPFVQHFGLMTLMFYNFFPHSFGKDCEDAAIEEIITLFSADEERIKADVKKEHEDLRRALEVPTETTANLSSSKTVNRLSMNQQVAFYKSIQMKMQVLNGRSSANLTLEKKQEIRIHEGKKVLKDTVTKEVEMYKDYLTGLTNNADLDWIDTILLFPSTTAIGDMKEHKTDVCIFWE